MHGVVSELVPMPDHIFEYVFPALDVRADDEKVAWTSFARRTSRIADVLLLGASSMVSARTSFVVGMWKRTFG